MNGKRAKNGSWRGMGRSAGRKLKRIILKEMRGKGQQPKSLRVRRHKPKDPIKPTWPRSLDQQNQSRPLIVMRPLWQRANAMKERGIRKQSYAAAQYLGAAFPKHFLDRIACNWLRKS